MHFGGTCRNVRRDHGFPDWVPYKFSESASLEGRGLQELEALLPENISKLHWTLACVPAQKHSSCAWWIYRVQFVIKLVKVE